MAAAFVDIDNDGDLDLAVGNYVSWSKDIDLSVNYRLDGIGRAFGPPTNFGVAIRPCTGMRATAPSATSLRWRASKA